MNTSQKRAQDRDTSINTARLLCISGFLVLDIETTSVGAEDEVVQLALFEHTPESETIERIFSLVQPTAAVIDYKAWQVHKITHQMLKYAGAPPITAFDFALLAHIYRLPLVIFNQSFDLRMLRQSFAACGVAQPPYNEKFLNVVCAMQLYTNFKGQLLSAKGRGGYKRQGLPGGDHSGKGDCLATIALIRMMANAHSSMQTKQFDTFKEVEHGAGSVVLGAPSIGDDMIDEFADLDIAADPYATNPDRPSGTTEANG